MHTIVLIRIILYVAHHDCVQQLVTLTLKVNSITVCVMSYYCLHACVNVTCNLLGKEDRSQKIKVAKQSACL